MKYSLNAEAQKIHELTSNKKVKHDCIINEIKSENVFDRCQVKTKSNCKSIVSREFKETRWNNFVRLIEQSTIVSSIVRKRHYKVAKRIEKTSG